jgi:hypothetical protein
MSCHYCKRDCSLLFVTRDWNCRTDDERFSYYRCDNCGLIFLDPAPNDIGMYYPKEYVPHALPDSQEQLAKWAELERYRLEIVQRFAQSGQLLEIGPGSGRFAYLAKQAGFEVQVVEMDTRCCEFLSSSVGVNAINTSDVASAFAGIGSKNVIALWHVIEHLANPWEILELIYDRLSDGGILVIAAPNPESLQLRVMRSHWVHVDAPRHINLIPLRLLDDHAQKHGLERVYITTTDPAGQTLNAMGWQTSLINSVTGSLPKFAMRVAGRLLRLLFSQVDRSGLHGAAYTAVYQKRV